MGTDVRKMFLRSGSEAGTVETFESLQHHFPYKIFGKVAENVLIRFGIRVTEIETASSTVPFHRTIRAFGFVVYILFQESRK